MARQTATATTASQSRRRARRRVPKNIEGLVAYHTGIMQNVSLIAQGNGNIENKNTALIAGILVVVPLLVTQVKDWVVLGVFGLYFMALSLTFALYSGWPRDAYPPTGDVRNREFSDYLGKANEKLLLALISDALGAIDEVADQNKMKANVYVGSVILFLLGTTMFLLSFWFFKLPVAWGIPHF